MSKYFSTNKEEIRKNIKSFHDECYNADPDNFYKLKKPIEEYSHDELRRYITIVNTRGVAIDFYDSSTKINVYKYVEDNDIEKKLNEEVFRRMGLEFYNYYSLVNKHPYDANIYQVLDLFFPDLGEMVLIRQAYYLMQIAKQYDGYDIIEKIMNIKPHMFCGTVIVQNDEMKSKEIDDQMLKDVLDSGDEINLTVDIEKVINDYYEKFNKPLILGFNI